MRITISGAAGFLGKNIISYLDNLFYINKLSRNELNNSYRNKVVSCDVIIHLAGKAHDFKNVSCPDQYYHVNFELTKTVYKMFLQSDAKKFIFISTVKASADIVSGQLTENDKPCPQTHYGKSKLMAEKYIQSQTLTAGKSYYILRPCMIHGPGNKGNLNLLYKFVSKGIPYPLAAFQNKRSFLSVENLCFVIKEILERDDIPSGIYHVADDEPLSTNELVTLIAEGSGKKPKLWKISEKWIRIFARIGDKLKLPLNTERLGKLTENYIVDNSKIKKALKKELPVTSKEGMLNTIRSFS